MDELSKQKSCRCSKCVIESLFIKCIYCSNSFILGGIYRHPNGNIKHFLTALENALTKIDGMFIIRRYEYRSYQVQFRRQLPICVHYYFVWLPALLNFTNTHL